MGACKNPIKYPFAFSACISLLFWQPVVLTTLRFLQPPHLPGVSEEKQNNEASFVRERARAANGVTYRPVAS